MAPGSHAGCGEGGEPALKWYSVDPGSVHVGLCEWQDDRAVSARELTPDGYMSLLEGLVGGVNQAGLLVVEDFRVEPGRATALAGSTLMVVQLIGATRLACRLGGFDLVLQPNKILNPAKGMMRAAGWSSVSAGSGGHAADAERHGFYYLRLAGRTPGV